MAQIHALTPEGRLPSGAVTHVQEITAPYDSGLRDVKGLVNTAIGWDTNSAALTATLERQGPNTAVSFSGLQNTADPLPTGWVDVMVLPPGFRPSADQYYRDFSGGRVRVRASGAVQVQNPSASLNYFTLGFLTRNARPDTPPGDPA